MFFDNKKLTEVGRLIKTHGLKGELSIKLFENVSQTYLKNEMPVFLLNQGIPVPFLIESHKNSGSYIVLKLSNIETEQEVIKFVNNTLLMLEEDIPIIEDSAEDELIGYAVYDDKYGFIGNVAEVNYIPGNPVIETIFDGKTVIIPMADEIIRQISHEIKEIRINAPDGLIEIYLG